MSPYAYGLEGGYDLPLVIDVSAFQMLLVAVVGWLNRREREALTYLPAVAWLTSILTFNSSPWSPAFAINSEMSARAPL
jgi:hypothetical protein